MILMPNMSYIGRVPVSSLYSINLRIQAGFLTKVLSWLRIITLPNIDIRINGKSHEVTALCFEFRCLVRLDEGVHAIEIFYDNEDKRWQRYRSKSLVVMEVS